NVLKQEFEFYNKEDIKKDLVIDFSSPLEKFTFCKRILTGVYQDSVNRFIQFQCKLEDSEISTNDLEDIIVYFGADPFFSGKPPDKIGQYKLF
ncbi:MAG TPA: hypothetical protein VKZ57_03850, partial [Sphingobacterium sp.]|nr:hypothetical protein [Sphingobacterium sp.]